MTVPAPRAATALPRRLPPVAARADLRTAHRLAWSGLALAGLLAVAVLVDAPEAVRAPLALLALVLVPGLPVAALLRPRDVAVAAMLVVSSSLTLQLLLAYGLVQAGALTAGHSSLALVLLTVALAVPTLTHTNTRS